MRKIQTEERTYKEYSGKAEFERATARRWTDAKGREMRELPMGEVVKEVVLNFRNLNDGACPFYSWVIEACAFDELTDILQDMADRERAETIAGMFRQLITAEQARQAFQQCGTVACDGTPLPRSCAEAGAGRPRVEIEKWR